MRDVFVGAVPPLLDDTESGSLLVFKSPPCDSRPSLAVRLAVGLSETIDAGFESGIEVLLGVTPVVSERALPEGSGEGTEGYIPFAA